MMKEVEVEVEVDRRKKMSIESRMDEFERVSNKKLIQDVPECMDEFESVDKGHILPIKEKTSTLPYGVKRFKTCPSCGEFMEIHELKGEEAIYHCHTCDKHISILINE